MFKAICIGEFDATGHNMPAIGDIVTVVEQEKDGDMLMYGLEEFPPIRYNGVMHRYTFEAEAFAPLTGHDERERLEAWQSEHLTKEDKMLMRIAEDMPEEALEPGAYERIWEGIKEYLNAPHE